MIAKAKKATAKEKASKRTALNWKCCRCSCRGHCATVGGFSLWMHNDLRGLFSVYLGHGRRGTSVGAGNSFKGADKMAAAYVRGELQKRAKILPKGAREFIVFAEKR